MFEFCWFSTAAIDWKSTKGNNNLVLMKPQYPKTHCHGSALSLFFQNETNLN